MRSRRCCPGRLGSRVRCGPRGPKMGIADVAARGIGRCALAFCAALAPTAPTRGRAHGASGEEPIAPAREDKVMPPAAAFAHRAVVGRPGEQHPDADTAGRRGFCRTAQSTSGRLRWRPGNPSSGTPRRPCGGSSASSEGSMRCRSPTSWVRSVASLPRRRPMHPGGHVGQAFALMRTRPRRRSGGVRAALPRWNEPTAVLARLAHDRRFLEYPS